MNSAGRLGPLHLLGVVLALVGCSTPARPPPSAIPPIYRVGPPDHLLISVLPEPVIEREVVVRPDGYISFDLIGDIRAGGRTTAEIAAEIELRISRFKRDARALVLLNASQTSQVTVFGEVSSPGLLPLFTEMTVAEAIGSRGGTTFIGWRSRVRLIRYDGGATKVHRIDLADIQAGDLSTNMTLQSGDILYVPKTPLGYVGGVIQQIVFPFTTLLGPAGGVANLSRAAF